MNSKAFGTSFLYWVDFKLQKTCLLGKCSRMNRETLSKISLLEREVWITSKIRDWLFSEWYSQKQFSVCDLRKCGDAGYGAAATLIKAALATAYGQGTRPGRQYGIATIFSGIDFPGKRRVSLHDWRTFDVLTNTKRRRLISRENKEWNCPVVQVARLRLDVDWCIDQAGGSSSIFYSLCTAGVYTTLAL